MQMRILVTTFVGLTLLGACGAPNAVGIEIDSARAGKGGPTIGIEADQAAPAPPPPPGEPPAQGTRPLHRSGLVPDSSASQTGNGQRPILIYTADITMAVFEVSDSLTRVETIAREVGGFLAKRDDGAITIRVPAEGFQEAVKRIETVGDMLHRNVSAQDVTEEYRDLEVRLKSARAVQERLMHLLAKADKVEDSLAIEKELDRVTGEIEHLEGKLKFLRDRAAFSTITVRFARKSNDEVGKAAPELPVPWLRDINLPRLLRL